MLTDSWSKAGMSGKPSSFTGGSVLLWRRLPCHILDASIQGFSACCELRRPGAAALILRSSHLLASSISLTGRPWPKMHCAADFRGAWISLITQRLMRRTPECMTIRPSWPTSLTLFTSLRWSLHRRSGRAPRSPVSPLPSPQILHVVTRDHNFDTAVVRTIVPLFSYLLAAPDGG